MRFLIIVVFAICGAPIVKGQDDEVKVRVFDADGQQVTGERESFVPYGEGSNYIYLNSYLLLRGALVFGYERILSDKHSITLSAGPTYEDFYEVFKGDEFFLSDEGKAIAWGHYLSLAYKFYPRGYQSFDGGIYLSPGWVNRKYNYDHIVSYSINTAFGASPETILVKGGKDMSELFLKIGYVYESFLIGRLTTACIWALDSAG